MKNFFKFKYPKIFGLIIAIIFAYLIFSNAFVKDSISGLDDWGYLNAFIAGVFFAFGFTSPLSAGLFITLNPENIWLVGVIGGLGAMLGDLFILQFIRFSFMDEFKKLKKEKISKEIEKSISKTLGNKMKIYLMYAFAGILIASPLPDEAGVIMLAGLTKIKPYILSVISFALNTIGILVLLCI